MPINKVGTKGIADGSIATADLNDGLVTSAKLQDGTVTNDKLTNTAFTLSGTSVSLGASTSITNKFVDWQSVITADGSTGTTGVAGRGYFINTTSAAHTFTLPSSATRGDTIAIKDYAGTFATFNLTIARNGHNIQGVANNSLISTNRASVVLVYVDVTRGWEFVEESNVADLQEVLFITATGGTVTTSGDFKIHSFTGDGCFVVSSVGNPAGSDKVDFLVVAGGGSGGVFSGGGGGAGGTRLGVVNCSTGLTVSTTTYPITIGGGGAANPGAGCRPNNFGNAGSNSIFSTITSTGGGAGGGMNASPGIKNGGSGGSGGGGAGTYFPVSTIGGTGGSGNTPPVSPSQGNAGGNGSPQPSPDGGGYGGGGGGGAGGTGNNGSGTNISPSSDGGVGLNVAPVFGAAPQPFYQADVPDNGPSSAGIFAGGGGGAINFGANPSGPQGGPGGGGDGGFKSPAGPGGVPSGMFIGHNGTSNTGGGGGGSGNDEPAPFGVSGAGGKGIVIIRYKFQ